MSRPYVMQKVIQKPLIKRKVIRQPIVRRKVVKKQLINSSKTLDTQVSENTADVSIPVKVPGSITYRQLINKPHVHTIREEVKVNKLPSKTLNLDKIVEPVRERTETRTQTFNAPANQIHHHSTVVPSINEHRVDVRFVKGEDMHQ